ncbi:hypothetical protein Tco_1539072 [Tanacetum coccineum]
MRMDRSCGIVLGMMLEINVEIDLGMSGWTPLSMRLYTVLETPVEVGMAVRPFADMPIVLDDVVRLILTYMLRGDGMEIDMEMETMEVDNSDGNEKPKCAMERGDRPGARECTYRFRK